MYKQLFNERKALRFRQFKRKGWALFACLGRVVTIGVLSVATLERASAATVDFSSRTDYADGDSLQTDREGSLDEVEVVGSRAPLAIAQAPRMVTVLTRADIQAAPAHSVNDLLKMAVGVDVRQRGPLGAQTDVGIRGSNSEQIAVLLNGVNICDPQTGHNTLELPCQLSDIVRIEVLEGPAGRVYGTSSLVGAVNIVTLPAASRSDDDGERRRATVTLEGGSFGYASAAVTVPLELLPAPVWSSLSASYTRSDGYSRSAAGRLNADYSGGKAFWQGSYRRDSLRLAWQAGLSVKGFGSNTFYSARFDEQYERVMKLTTAVSADVRTGRLHLRPAVSWNRTYDRFELIRGRQETVPFNHHRNDVFGLSLGAWFDSPLGRTAFGAEMRNEDIVSGNLGEPLSEPHGNYTVGLNRTNLSLHVEHNILLRRLTLSAGFVAVKNTWNEMPLTVYPGIDASLALGRGWKAYASYNSSLRMPSFTELYYSVGGHKADKHLKPEELRAVEGGVTFSGSMLSLQASVFHNHSRNMIDWVMDTRQADAPWQSVNHTRVNTFGQEVSAALRLSPMDLQVSYCHLDQTKETAGYLQSQYSLEYLRHKFTARLRATLTSRLSLTVGYRWQQREGTYTTTGGDVVAYHPYSVVDARLEWNAAAYSVYVDGQNLTGHRYVDYGNVPQPGCWVTVGAICRL